MVQSIQSLYAYGRAFDVVLIAAGLVAAAAAIVTVWSCVLPRGWTRWQRRRARRRYVRTGLRELERYLERPPGTRGPRSG